MGLKLRDPRAKYARFAAAQTDEREKERERCYTADEFIKILC